MKAFQELPERVYDASAPWDCCFLSSSAFHSTFFDSSGLFSFVFPGSSWLILTPGSDDLQWSAWFCPHNKNRLELPVLLIPCNPQTIPKQSPNNHVVWICLIWGRLWVIKFSDFSTTLCNFRTTHTSPGCSTQCATLQTSYSSPSKKCCISLAVSILGAVVYSQPGPGEILEAASVPICPFLEFASLHCFQDQKPLTVRERQESCDSLKFVKLIYVSLPCLWQQNQHWWQHWRQRQRQSWCGPSPLMAGEVTPLRSWWPCPKNTRNKSEPATNRHCWLILSYNYWHWHILTYIWL